ncbi:hypothetical protein [Enterobacter asburiae]|uniref:hypothetical protein n=1 Tax=Enterobacter asburiae TaxID=61645 RepID=UPI001F36EDCA|nr:hypothetical protein [Enterobacter asburiae]
MAGRAPEDDTTPVLTHLTDDARHRVVALIADFRLELNKRAIGPRGRQVLDHLMPHLLSEVCSRADAPGRCRADAAVKRDHYVPPYLEL